MRKFLVILGCLSLLSLAACSSGNDSKKSTDNTPPKKSVFDPYMKDVKKAKQVQGQLDAAQQKQNAQLQQAVSSGTSSQPQPAQPSGGN